jgi:hypothetical protein
MALEDRNVALGLKIIEITQSFESIFEDHQRYTHYQQNST